MNQIDRLYPHSSVRPTFIKVETEKIELTTWEDILIAFEIEGEKYQLRVMFTNDSNTYNEVLRVITQKRTKDIRILIAHNFGPGSFKVLVDRNNGSVYSSKVYSLNVAVIK